MRVLSWIRAPQQQFSELCEGGKSFCSLCSGLEVLTACSQHITHCVIGQKRENVALTSQRNG